MARMSSPRTRTIAGLAAALALGAGGGAGAGAVLDRPTATTTTVTQSSPRAAVAAVQKTDALTVNEIYRRARPSVVDITTTGQTGGGEGTGFVLNKSGDIVTNQHVVDGASAISVTFSDGRKAGAKVVGTD